MLLHTRVLVAASIGAAAFATSAGTVDVSFVNAGRYWDAGSTTFDEEGNMKALANLLQRLGQRLLPADQVLKVEVLQLELAGKVRQLLRDRPPVRVITNGSDAPHIKLRYSLETAGKPVANGEEWLSDIDFTRGLARQRDNESLYFEKRMLEAWFKARFVDGTAAPG